MKISEPPLWILLWISSKVFNTAMKLRSVSFLPLISVIMRLFFIFVPWIYAPAFNSIWPISLNRLIFFFFIHACLLCGWFCDPLYVFVWIPFLEGGTNGARWLLRQFLVIHLVPDQIQSSVVALNFIWLDTQKKKEDQTAMPSKLTLSNQIRQNERSDLEPSSRGVPDVRAVWHLQRVDWLQKASAWKWPLWPRRQNKQSSA